jgi:ABC-type transport system involved in cytochrome c biogenesis permease subunit
MNRLKKLPREARIELGFGAFLIILSTIWLSVILYVLSPNQIQPTSDDLQAAYDAFTAAAGNLANEQSLNTAGAAILSGLALLAVNILFVVARYGGLTLLFLGGFAVFEALSKPRRAGR